MLKPTSDNPVNNMDANTFFFQGSGTVTLCGSTKFFFHYMEANRILTFLDWIVLQCGSYGHSFHRFAKEEVRDYTVVKKLHFLKIRQSDAILVCTDETGYLGTSTLAEISFAKKIQLPVYYFNGNELYGECEIISVPKRKPDKLVTQFLLEYDGDTGVNDPKNFNSLK